MPWSSLFKAALHDGPPPPPTPSPPSVTKDQYRLLLGTGLEGFKLYM